MKYALLLVVAATSTLCSAQLQIDTAEVIEAGGIRHFVTIQASDTTNPVLLFLHGGPGGSVMSYAEKFTDKLRDHFIVVQWDQRQTGKTMALNPSPCPLSLGVFQRDTKEMVEALLRRFRQNKLYLAGHSWGTALGFYMAKEHAELLHAYISIGPMVHQVESERIALALMKTKASEQGDRQALRELDAVRIPFENGKQLYYHRKWLLKLGGSSRNLSESYVEQWAHTWLSVFNEASADNLFESLPEVACPVYFLAGRKDYQTNCSLAEKYYSMLRAPRKAFFWFDTGHSIPGTASGRMQEVIVDVVVYGRQPTVHGSSARE